MVLSDQIRKHKLLSFWGRIRRYYFIFFRLLRLFCFFVTFFILSHDPSFLNLVKRAGGNQ
jgi:hypothetical protein